MPRAAKGGPRDAIMSMRIPARLKFALEMTARLNHEAMNDVIIRALNDTLTSENGGLLVHLPGEELPVFLLPKVWDERESVRLVKLALTYPALMTLGERETWATVEAEDRYWSPQGKKAAKSGARPRRLEDLDVEALEADWGRLKSSGDGR